MELSSPLIGDGYCQDGNNNGACNYDGGDCCGPCVSTEHCTECQCLGGENGNAIPSALIGDGYCQDETNKAECYHDGQDCCGSLVNRVKCFDCTCQSMHFFYIFHLINFFFKCTFYFQLVNSTWHSLGV